MIHLVPIPIHFWCNTWGGFQSEMNHGTSKSDLTTYCQPVIYGDIPQSPELASAGPRGWKSMGMFTNVESRPGSFRASKYCLGFPIQIMCDVFLQGWTIVFQHFWDWKPVCLETWRDRRLTESSDRKCKNQHHFCSTGEGQLTTCTHTCPQPTVKIDNDSNLCQLKWQLCRKTIQFCYKIWYMTQELQSIWTSADWAKPPSSNHSLHKIFHTANMFPIYKQDKGAYQRRSRTHAIKCDIQKKNTADKIFFGTKGWWKGPKTSRNAKIMWKFFRWKEKQHKKNNTWLPK